MIFILLTDRKLLRTVTNVCAASQVLLAFDRYIKKGESYSLCIKHFLPPFISSLIIFSRY